MRFAYLFPLVWALAACAGVPPASSDQANLAPPDEWRVDVAEHLGLWYHGNAYLAERTGSAPGAAAADPALPLLRPGYAAGIASIKRRTGAYPTALDRRAAEFAERLAGEDYAALAFLPLYFEDAGALFSAIRVWGEVNGDPRRAASREGAQAIAFLASAFPRAEQRRAVVDWAAVLEQEAQEFYREFWREALPARRDRTAAVQREWDALAPALRMFLDYLGLEGGTLFLVPALGAEGRIVPRGPGAPMVAVLDPPPAEPRAAVWAFVHELVYPLASETVREYVSPARIRELGRASLETRTAVRGGALLLEAVARGSVPPEEFADGYRRFFLLRSGGSVDAGESVEAAFREAFPLSADLERGLVGSIERALAGI